ncbi:MAG: hypothetical protein PVJ32_06390, partial [Anaerolineales bacterium]
MMRGGNRWASIVVLFMATALLVLVACDFRGGPPLMDIMATAAAQTVSAHLTRSSGPPTMDTLTPTMDASTETATPILI